MHSIVDSWFVRNSHLLTRIFAIIFGIVWGIDGTFKFIMDMPKYFTSMITSAGVGQPAWLRPWFSFWATQTAANPTLWVYLIGVLELALAFALITGFLRKTAYGGGFVLSLLIWSVPEGFGGPYGPGSTDIGTGIIYAIVFLFLLMLNASHGPDPYTLDYKIERKVKWWKIFAELKY